MTYRDKVDCLSSRGGGGGHPPLLAHCGGAGCCRWTAPSAAGESWKRLEIIYKAEFCVCVCLLSRLAVSLRYRPMPINCWSRVTANQQQQRTEQTETKKKSVTCLLPRQWLCASSLIAESLLPPRMQIRNGDQLVKRKRQWRYLPFPTTRRHPRERGEMLTKGKIKTTSSRNRNEPKVQ